MRDDPDSASGTRTPGGTDGAYFNARLEQRNGADGVCRRSTGFPAYRVTTTLLALTCGSTV